MKKYRTVSPFLFLFLFSLMTSSILACYSCPCEDYSCDEWIECAMEKQRKVIEKRLEDFEGAVEANNNQTENHTKIIEEEILSYEQLRARITAEAIMLKKLTYISNNIKSSSTIEVVAKATKEGIK